MPPRRALQAVIWISTASILLAILSLALTSVWWPLVAVMVFHTIALRRFRDEMNTILSTREPGVAADFLADVLTHRSRDLDALADLLTHLERARFQGSRLVLLHSRLSDGVRASRIIRRLHRLSEIHDSQKNMAVVPVGLFLFAAYSGQEWMLPLSLIVAGLLLLVRPHVALAVERWRSRHGQRIRVWVETIAQFEALGSIAGYRYEHAEDPFPEIVPADSGSLEGALFEGVQLGHPLLPRATMVPNDVRLCGKTRLLVVSGSNMSGKSTLLRTVGINAVMALAGAPVRAASLRLSPLAVGATLQIQDSLLEGRSRFYAEITRIRTLADLAAGPVPLLFLLDELFHGTNSHDRRVGAQGVLRSLLDRGAIGLITTHDLALTEIADELAPRAVNVHFQDWFDDNAITFDYRMRPGPVTRSNALALMRAVGLEVASPTSLESS
jgi:MutS domain V